MMDVLMDALMVWEGLEGCRDYVGISNDCTIDMFPVWQAYVCVIFSHFVIS